MCESMCVFTTTSREILATTNSILAKLFGHLVLERKRDLWSFLFALSRPVLFYFKCSFCVGKKPEMRTLSHIWFWERKGLPFDLDFNKEVPLQFGRKFEAKDV